MSDTELRFIRQHIEASASSELRDIVESGDPGHRDAKRAKAVVVLQELLRGIDRDSVKKVVAREAKGIDAAAGIKFSDSKVTVMLGTTVQGSGVELELMIFQYKRGKFGKRKVFSSESAEIVRSLVSMNFSRLFHTEATWLSHHQFEESFDSSS